ncbi:hypothetical protein [Deinococcus sp.]|uniref:hypothetical protein n=1 Tax=Deinococcus sp. TaxID=47478 RepID=UPI0025E60555|nr:hypothetical protein [Deinococcus sp.]
MLCAAAALVWLKTERRWSGALYCIQQPGTLWNGLAPLPTGFSPECPPSSTYRQEVRSGQSRVESYRAEGWQPKALLDVLKSKGYGQTTDDPISPGNYAAFLEGPSGTVQYVASLEGTQTVTTLSGRP